MGGGPIVPGRFGEYRGVFNVRFKDSVQHGGVCLLNGANPHADADRSYESAPTHRMMMDSAKQATCQKPLNYGITVTLRNAP